MGQAYSSRDVHGDRRAGCSRGTGTEAGAQFRVPATGIDAEPGCVH
jgi:hypothetical protein